MNIRRLALTLVCAMVFAFGTSLSVTYHYERAFDRAVDATQSVSLRPIAMQLLRDVAEGHPEKVSSDVLARLGLGSYQPLFRPFAKDPAVRARAYRAIGRTGLAEAVQYLQALTPAQVGDLGPRDSHQAWPAAQIALQEARLLGIKAPQEQVAFLEKAMAGSYDSSSTGNIHFWAIGRLCDMGNSASLPLIEKRLRSMWSQQGESEISWCRERMQVVKSHPDRAKALGLVLNIGTSGRNLRLTSWAIGELAAMKSAEANAELDRFAAEIRGLPPLGRDARLAYFAEQIAGVRRATP